MDFSDIIGQQEMAQRLAHLADSDKLPHAIMLCGPDGCGKFALALALASHILNKGSFKVKGVKHPDLHFSFPTIKLPKWNGEYKPISDDFIEPWYAMIEKSPYFSFTDWMNAIGAENQQAIITVGEANELIKRLSMKSNQGGWKISIIWLPERMNQECANKMLKLIEEPPAETLFIMVCREPEKLLDTIRSRVQRFDVKPIAADDMQQALIQRRMLHEDDARRITRLAGGNWLAAVGELETGNENEEFFDLFVMLMRKAYTHDVKDLKRWSENIAKMGREQQKRLLAYFLRMTREAFMYNFRIPQLSYMTQAEENFCTKFARFINENNVFGFQETFQTATRDIGQNANAKMVFFDITMKVAILLHSA